MIRDYAKRNNTQRGKQKKPKRAVRFVIFFLVFVGIFIILVVYQKSHLDSVKDFIVQKFGIIISNWQDKKVFRRQTQIITTEASQNVSPRFDFYSIETPKKSEQKSLGYELEIALTSDFAVADNLKAKLALLGFTASITPVHKQGVQKYYVSVGPYDDKAVAVGEQQKLEQSKIKSVIVKMQ